MATVNEVANLLLHLRDNDLESNKNYSLSNLKMQKLLYFCQGIFLASNEGRRLIEDDDFLAWRYGPVSLDAYHRFKIYGQNDIPKEETGNFNRINERELQVVQSVWNTFKDKSAFDLVKASHVENSPWYNVFHNNETDVILTEDIREYFERLLTNE